MFGTPAYAAEATLLDTDTTPDTALIETSSSTQSETTPATDPTPEPAEQTPAPIAEEPADKAVQESDAALAPAEVADETETAAETTDPANEASDVTAGEGTLGTAEESEQTGDPEQGEGQPVTPAEENPGQNQNEPEGELIAFPMLSRELHKADGNEKAGFAEAGDTIIYTLTVSDLSLEDYANARISDERLGWNNASLTEFGLYFEENHLYWTSGTYTVTQADVDAGQPINNIVTFTVNGHETKFGAQEGEIPTQEAPEDTRQADFTVELQSSYDVRYNVINYAITIKNTGELDLSGLTITPTFDKEGTFTFAEGTPEVLNLPLGAELVVHGEFALASLGSDEGEEGATEEGSTEGNEAAQDEEEVVKATFTITDPASGKQRIEEIDTEAFIRFIPSFVVDGKATGLFEADGTTPRDPERLAVPGTKVVFTFTIFNDGMTELEDIVVKPLDPRFVPLGSWEVTEPLKLQQEISFTGVYTVTEDDVVADQGQEEANGIISAGIEYSVDGQSGTFESEGIKVANEYPYTIRYWLDDGSGNKPEVLEEVENTAGYGSTITLEEGDEKGQLNYLMPKGYQAEAAPLQITSDPASNVLDVVFTKAKFPYYIYYYAEGEGENLLIEGGVYGGEAPFESTVTLDAKALNDYCPVGYSLLGVSSDYAVEISTDEASNVINVVYPRDTFTYTINYYKDSD